MTTDIKTEQRVSRLRTYALRTGLRLVAGLVILFLILRIAAPWLINLHDTVALWIGGALLVACPFIAIQLAYGLWRDWRRSHRDVAAV